MLGPSLALKIERGVRLNHGIIVIGQTSPTHLSIMHVPSAPELRCLCLVCISELVSKEMIKGKLRRKKGFKTFFVDRNGTRLMDGNVASTIHITGHGDSGHPGLSIYKYLKQIHCQIRDCELGL